MYPGYYFLLYCAPYTHTHIFSTSVSDCREGRDPLTKIHGAKGSYAQTDRPFVMHVKFITPTTLFSGPLASWHPTCGSRSALIPDQVIFVYPFWEGVGKKGLTGTCETQKVSGRVTGIKRKDVMLRAGPYFRFSLLVLCSGNFWDPEDPFLNVDDFKQTIFSHSGVCQKIRRCNKL